MSNHIHTAQQYWDVRSDLFANYYTKPSLFDKIFRKGVYIRTAVTTKAAQDLDKPTILDIGSGPGVNSVTFLKNSNASHLFGLDFAPSMVEFAKKFTKEQGVGDRSSFVDGDFMTYDFGGKAFDLCAAMGFFDYIGDAEACIKRIGALTNKVAVISWPENGLRMFLRRQRYTCPVYHYTETQIRSLHQAAGFTKIEFVKAPGGWVTVAYK